MPVITELKDAQEKFNIKSIKNSSEHEDKSFEMIESEGKIMKPKGFMGPIKHNNIHIMGVLEGEQTG